MGEHTLTGEGNPILRLRLDPLLFDGLRAAAITSNVTTNQLVKNLLVAFVKLRAEERGGLPTILRHLDVLIATLQAQSRQLALRQLASVSKQPMKTEKDTQAKRLDLHDTVDAILKTVIKLCENEKAASSAKARMQAMRLANTTIRTDLALLQGFDKRDIELLIEEVKETNESLKAQLRASQKRAKENSRAAS